MSATVEPRIQYAKTSDGVDIAYATAGTGKPLVIVPSPANSHVELMWEMFSSVLLPLAQTFRLVWYDSRGAGLSDRDELDFSTDALTRDLEAVVDGSALESFALVGFIDGVHMGLSYAASQPERVSHLILCDGWTKFSDYAQSPVYQIESALREKDWVLYTETFAQVLWNYEDPAFARQFAEYMRACAEPEAWRAAQTALEGYDATELLAQVRSPTLVVHNRSNRFLPMRSGQRLAAGIAGARFVAIDDMTYAAAVPLIQEFVAGGIEKSMGVLPSGMTAILFADIADSTALTERLGDAAFRDKARDLDSSLRNVIRDHAGTAIEGKLLGDGVLAVFTSARQAIEAALTCAKAGAEASLPLHLGLHAGDVIREDNNVYGGAVNIASRISGLSAPGEVLVSDTVRSLARTSAGVRFEDRGEQELKGVGEPVRVWAVRET